MKIETLKTNLCCLEDEVSIIFKVPTVVIGDKMQFTDNLQR